MEEVTMEVEFHEYCPICKHADVPEIKDPCNECLGAPYNLNSRKPINWEEDDERRNKRSKIE